MTIRGAGLGSPHPPTPMLTPAQVNEFKTQGYLRGPTVLTDAEVEALRSEVERVIAERERKDIPQPVLCHNFTGDESAPVWQIVNIWEASRPFAQLIRHQVIGEEIAALEAQLEVTQARFDELLLGLPNLTMPEVPEGDETHNVIVRSWGEPPSNVT